MPRLRTVKAEFKVCACGKKYLASKCTNDHCHQAFNEHSMRRITQERLIVVDDETQHAERATRYRCTRRETHYRLCNRSPTNQVIEEKIPADVRKSALWDNLCEQPHCPICDEPITTRNNRKAKPSTAWILIFPVAINPDHLDHNRRLPKPGKKRRRKYDAEDKS